LVNSKFSEFSKKEEISEKKFFQESFVDGMRIRKITAETFFNSLKDKKNHENFLSKEIS